MPAFDADSYFNRRFNEQTAIPAGYDGGPSVSRTKFDELMAASAEKTAALQYNAEQSAQARAASEDSWANKMGLDSAGVVGSVLNLGAAGVEGAVNIPRFIGTSLHTLNAVALDANIPDAAKLAEQRYRANTATPEDMTLLNLTAGMVKEPVWQTPFQKESRKGAQTNLQRIDSMKEALRKASIVRDTMDVSSIVHRERQQVLEQDLRNGFKPGMAQVSEGWDDVKNGDAVTGSAKSAMGVARLLMNIGTSAVTNPMASLEYVTSNIPQLVLASGGAAGMALTNIPYALEEFGKGITAYQKEHGVLPPAEEIQRMAALAGSLALAETLGDKLTLGAGKVAGLFGKEALETGQAVTRKGFKESLFNPKNSAIGRTGVAVVEGGTGEFATEAYQTTAENAIQGKATSLEDAYVGGALGAISGGTLSGGIHAGSELATGIARAPKAAKPAQSTQPVDSPQQQLDFKAAIASNDPSVFLDQASPSYNPVKAVSVLQANNDNTDTAPEVKQANYQQAQTIVTDLDSQLENAKEDYQFARKSPAAKQAEVDFYKAELAKIDPADTEGKATYETMVAHYEGMLAPLTAAQVRSTEANLSRMDRQLKEARTVKGRMVPHVTPAAFAQQVAAVQAPVDPQDTEDITASKAAATSLINLSMASPELLTPEVAKQLYKSTSSGLDDSQREYLRVFSEARIAQNALQDSDRVHQTILYGDKKNDQAGIVQHRERITDAIEAGNKKAAERGLKTLNSFAVDQQGKLTAIQAALDSDSVQKNRQTVQVVKNKDTGQWEQYTGDIPLTEKERAANGGLNIHRGSGKIVGSIAVGATAISTAAAEMESAYGLKFGNVLNKANKTNTSSAPVQKTKESIQVPVVPSLSPSIDNKVLEGRERVNTKVLPLSAGKANWSRYAPAGTGYEVSTQGDTRFSALNAKLADGRTIEEAYQLDVKGFRDPAKLNQSWKDGKGKAPKTPLTPSQTWEAYKGLWQQWAKENPKLIQELRTASAGKTLTDKFAGTPVSQARALAEILAAEASQEATTAQDVPTSPEFSKQADQNLEYLRNPPMGYTPAKATEIGAWAQSNIAALTKAMQDVGEDLDEADRLETLRSDMRWMVSKAKEMVAADTVLEENLGPQDGSATSVQWVTEHVAGQAELQGMTIREATTQEMKLYGRIVDEISLLFPAAAAATSFLVHDNHRWQGAAHAGSDGKYSITLSAKALASSSSEAYIRKLIAHELAHIQDAQNAWASSTSKALSPGGKVYQEAMASRAADSILAKWFGYIETNNKSYPTAVKKANEMYAQLHALFVIHPDLMKEHLPNAYNAITKTRAALTQGVAADQPVADRTGSSETGGQPTSTETNGAVEQGVQGVVAEETAPAATGKLSILARTSAEELPEGTLLGKVYQSINKAVAFLTQKETKVEKDEDIAKDRPLVSIANFLSRWNKEEVTPDSFFVNELSTEENLALNTFKEYATAWSEVAKADFIKGSLPNGAGNKIREDYLFHDPVQDFINPDGSVDENLVTAVVASAYSWLVDSLNNPPLKLKDDILTMHGLKEDDTLTSKGRDDLARFATMEDTAINSMGDILVDLLGLQAGPKAPKDYLPKVSAAFGVHALRLLEAQGLVKRATIDGATLNEYMPNLKLPVSKWTKASIDDRGREVPSRPIYPSISYIQLTRAGKEDRYALEGDSRRIRDSVVGSGAVLDRLFGSEHSPAEASWKPIPFNQTKAKRTAQGISDKQHAIITEAQQHENRIIPAMWTALQVLGGAVILQVAGHVEYDETKIQKENQGSVMAQNLNLENQLEGMQQLVGQAEANSPLGLDQPFFANHEVWRNFRVGITTRNMNLQTSKIHRFMFFRPEWASTIRMDEDSKVEHFKVALAAAFGIKTDQQPNEQTVEMFDAMLAKADNRIVDLAMKLHADIQNPDSPLLSQEDKSAIGALSAGKEGMQTLQAMVALGIYLDALSQGKEDFTVHLLVGVDGKTNGPILSHLALGAAASPEELFKHMNRGGMFQKEGRFKNFNHWYQQATSLDLYEDLARVVLGAIPKNMPNMDAFYVITKDLLHNGKVTGAGRKIVKTPLTSFAFGSTIEKSLQNMQQAFLQGVIDRIESVANDPAGSVSREKLITSINALIKMGGNRYAELLAKDASIEELMGMEFSKAQKQALGDAFHIIMGDALESSMKTYFEVFMKRRDAVNGAIQTAYGVYAAIYQDLRNIELNRLMDSGEIGFTQTKDGREPWYDLTNAQEQALREKVADVLPRAHTAYTHGTDALKDGLMMAKSRRGVSQLPMHKVKAQLAQRFTDAKGKQVSHIDTRAMTTSETSPGVAGLPYFMHSLDSFIMHMSLQGTESLNVHDEAANGADKVTGTAKAINGATWTGMLNFSPATEAYEMLERSLVNAVKLLESGDITQASLDLIRAAFLKQIPYKIRKQVKPENIALVAMQMAKGHQYKAEEIRLSTLVQMGYLDQYTWEGGEYEVTDADTAAAQAKLDALDKLMTYESDQAAEALGKAFKAGIKTKPVTVIVEADPTSSGMDDIDASDPNEETAASPVPPVLAGISTQELYAALPSTVSGTFDGHLKGLLDGMVSKLHGPFGSFKQAIMAAQPLGPLERMAKAQAEGKAPLSVSALASGIRFSDQEAFVMEQVQATVKATLEGNDGQTAITYGELSKLFMEAKKRIVPADFATGDPAQDQAIHDFLFNHTDVGKGNRSDYLARFAAVGLAHEGFNKLLQVETSRAAPVLKGEKTIAAFLKRAFDSLLDWFNGRMSNTQPGQKGSEKLTALVEQLVQIELKRQARAADTSFDIVDAFDEKSKALADGVAAKLGEIGKSAFFQQSRSKVLKASGSLVSMVAEDRVKWLVEGMNKFRDEYMDKEQGVIAAVFKDVVGYAAQQQVLLRMAVKNQGERKDIITNTTKLVRESFVNQGKELTDQAKSALTAVLLRTGAHTLLSPTFDTVQLQELLGDANKLTAAIQAQEAMLSVFPARFQNYFLRQSKDLAHYLVHSEAKGQHLMMNAGNIARMYETIHQGKLSEVETQQAETVIDSLVSLYALKMSSPDSKAEVVAMMKAEHARTDGGNGVHMALLLHKDMESQAKERLFGDSPALLVKGYTPEIYNPYTAIQVADSEEGKLLLEQGYMAGDYVKQDPDDPREEQKRIYVLRDGGAAPLQTGILSYTGTRHKGSTLHSGKNVKMQKQVLLDKQAAIDKMFEPNPTYDPAKGRGTHMVPLLNATGKAVNYHYMMSAKTKDALLERNSRFDDVLGVQAGSVFDKATVGAQNRKAIQALRDMYLEDFKNNPGAYVQVGPTSPDAENRELYKLLPKVTQQAITDIWGKEGLMVRSDHKDLYFGYHKLSLSSAWDKYPMSFSNPDFWNTDPTRRNIGQQVLVSSVTWALEQYARNYLKMGPTKAREYAKRGAVAVRRGENIWQAVVREIKDIYVIKAVTSMLNNIGSNLSLLSLHGVPVMDSLRYHQEAMRGVSDYERDTTELFKLEQQIKVGLGMGDMGEAKQRLSRLKDAIARNPVKPLIDAGLMPTIVEDVEADVDPFSYKSQFLRKTEKYTSKLNPKVRQAARVAFMAHDTQAYKTLHHFTQLSDFVARYALYQHLTTRKKNALASPEALHAASEAFIFYDIPMHRKLQYVEDMGLVMFTKYFIRIQRVLAQRVKENPGRVLTSILTHHYIGGVPGVMDASAIAHFGNNPLSTGALGFPGALPDLGTVQAMDGMLGLLK